ncbi:hypothetical protein BW723_12315 [Polaribacter reichenbachii]|uniref:DUF4268 domain-containing protein n=1 Tax=Polaribacter reichenbachii TaxID=996801 RepID=A0A1B8TPD0_9FLAO|nr:DUF4268 domain-containing protein [Polaribacter reichenbachii]APZ47018.1 hypothetical protein BW723_12315 [Polaribacter reichenbachii]AUC17660.1 hypothetical protein BTO17_02765 [Polaribacter reichenbachii]OBY61466.1 hypothetical protein LPB301_15460 [Polaribacter reichenbachii]
MFSKEEAAQIRKLFWTSFGKSFPRKWLLYNTKIKGFSFKFVADRKKAMVCLDIENPDELVNLLYYDQLLSLKTLLETELPEVIFDDDYLLESGKTIHRIYVTLDKKFSIYNKNTWRDCYEFYVETMEKFELFFYEYEDVIKNI